MIARTIALLSAVLLLFLPDANAQQPTSQGDTITTKSGLKYVFLKKGTGPVPQAGDVLVLHGIGRLADGKEFWNTRTDNQPFTYTAGIDDVIAGFAEGMKYVRQGDRVEFHMIPSLAYGARGNKASNIPPNSELTFDYEVLSVHRLALTNLLRAGLGNVDSTLAALKKLPNLNDYYADEMSIYYDAQRAGWRDALNTEKILKFGISLFPSSYRLPYALALSQAQRGAKVEAKASFETALRLNPRVTPTQQAEFTEIMAEIKKLQTPDNR